MSLFDTIEVNHNIINGPYKDEYLTKSLDCSLNTYVIQDGQLLLRVVKYEVVPENERTHPILGILKPNFVGFELFSYTGSIEMYSSTSTWNLVFVDGKLTESKMTEYFAIDPDNNPTSYGDGDCNGPDSDFIEDNEEFDFNPQEYSE